MKYAVQSYRKLQKNITSFVSAPQFARALCAFFIVALYPDASFAETLRNGAVTNVGSMFCNVLKNSGNFPPLFSGIAYITGAWIVLRGLWDMMKRSSDPTNKPFKDGILGVTMGGLIAAIPNLINWLHKSVFKDLFFARSGVTCDRATDVPLADGTIGLDVMMANFVKNIGDGIMPLISGMAVIFGIAMIFFNMVKLSKFGSDAKTNTLTPIIGSLIIGALLVAIGQTMEVSLGTLFGDGTSAASLKQYSGIAYAPLNNAGMANFNVAMTAVFKFLYIVGSLSFVRGFFVMKNALEGSGQATKGQAYTHIIGGTLLVNMPGFIEYISNTFGVKILN